ncbi:MAG: ABC transporter substrate-binding protein [Armatimonadetes bacterium]|nr:ABC transporter substrate-binding protein [Armatimonadota bacterium]
MRRERVARLLVGVILILGLGIAAPPGAAQGEPIHVGVIVDITGPASSLGIPERDTVAMLQEEINRRGGVRGRPFVLTVLDGQSRETETLLAAKRLMEQERIYALICCTQSGTSLAILDTMQKARIPMMSLAASIRIVEPARDRFWVFKTPQSDVLVATVLINHLLQKNIRRVAWMNVDNAFGDSGRGEFEKVARAKGLNIVASERFGDRDVDMTAQLTRIARTDAQGVVIWAIPPAAAVVTKNVREIGLRLPVFQSHGVANKAFIDLSGPAANGVIFPAGKLLVAEGLPDGDAQKRVLVDYARKFEARFGPRNTFGGHAWDGVWLVYNAVQRALQKGGNPVDRIEFRKAVRDELEATRNFVGISGVFNMSSSDHNGLDERALTLIEVADGKWRVPR